MLNTREIGSVQVIDLEQKLDTQTAAPTQEALLLFLSNQPAQVLINLSGLEFVSSAGLRVILRAAKQVRSYKGAMKVAGASGMVKEVLEISGFDSLLDMYELEQQALDSFG